MKTQRRALRQASRLMALWWVVGLAGSVLAAPGRPAWSQSAPRRQGLSTKQKVAILVGAAALYYLYKKHQDAKSVGPQGQYYLSKNGRVYYRDRKGTPHWVTPPAQGVQVPASEAQPYSRYQGYNGQTTGASFGGYGARPSALGGGPPGPGR